MIYWLKLGFRSCKLFCYLLRSPVYLNCHTIGPSCCTISQLSCAAESSSPISQSGKVVIHLGFNFHSSCYCFLQNWVMLIIAAGGRDYFGSKACKRTRMGHQCRRGVSSLLWRKRRWILCLCRHFSLHTLCLCSVKHIKVPRVAVQMK